ncbi:MAG: exodeoxyribonuclease VII small subunit [Desulfobacteraceae bacterium]|nr:exodeoxyribonuclease VII small subunit [Desulfobacteraceae bacterium]
MARQAEQTFETALEQLEKIVQGLETGNLPLEEAMKQFEQGVKLSKFCSEKLDETEKKVTILLQDQNGNVSEKPFISEK